MKSTWTIFTNANKEDGAKKILTRVLSNMGVKESYTQINLYHKGGFKIDFCVDHGDQEWDNIIVECIALGQKTGYDWQLFGDILHDPSAITNKANVSGVEMIEWQIIKIEN